MARPPKRILWKILLPLAVLAIAWAVWPRAKPLRVLVAKAEPLARLEAVVNGSGEIRTKDSVEIQAEIAGVIVELPVREGDVVAKNQVILKIDPFQMESEVAATRASLSALEAESKGQEAAVESAKANLARDTFLKKSAEVELRQAQANQARAREAFNREKRLLEAKLSAPDQFEVVETQLKVQEAQVDAAGAKIDQLDAQIKAARSQVEYAQATLASFAQRIEGARSGLRRSEDLFSKTTIRSPLDGVIVKLNVEVGERAVPGIQSNPLATLMVIADLRIMEAELKVDETDIVTVKMGDEGKVIVDALPDATLQGRVIEIGNSPIASASGSQEGKDFKVVLRIGDPPSTLRPGMSCEADITTAVRSEVLAIPIQALTAREVDVDAEGRYVPPRAEPEAVAGQAVAAPPVHSTQKELQGVFLVGADEKARFRPVTTGILGETDLEVLEGVAVGEEVVVGPLKALRTLEEGTLVEVDRTKPFRRSKRLQDSGTEEEGAEK